VAQQVAWQKWATYEEMATREASHFHPPVWGRGEIGMTKRAIGPLFSYWK